MATFPKHRANIPRLTALETDPPALLASKLGLREANNKKPIYQIHKWWARRLGPVFRAILLAAVTPAGNSKKIHNGAFYRKHDLSGLLVLDPFVGGGTSVVEASKLGANVVGVDIDPVACFVTRKELEHIDETALLSAFHQIEARLREQILGWYRTELPDGRSGIATYVFWVDVISCPSCRQETLGHPHYQLNRNPSTRTQTVFCSHCGEIAKLPLRRKRFQCKSCFSLTEITKGPVRNGQEFVCPNCTASTILRSAGPNRRVRQKIFALQVLVDGTDERVFKKADREDLELYRRACRVWASRRRSDRFVPQERIPLRGRDDGRPIIHGYKRYSDLFNPRQLLCLSSLAEAISDIEDPRAKEFVAAAFSDSLAANNMLCLYAFDYDKLTPLFGLHAYRRVTRPVENNVWGLQFGRGSFLKCFRKLLRAKRYSARPYENRYRSSKRRPERIFTGEKIDRLVDPVFSPKARGQSFASILNQSAENLALLKTRSVDIILTDPPYYDNLAYSELSDFYHVWLRRLGLRSYASSRLHSPLSESMYVRRYRPDRRARDHELYVSRLRRVFKECHRVLNDSGLMIFTFHHKLEIAWACIVDALTSSGFVVTNAFPVRSEGQSEFHSANGNLKWDVVFVCRKRGTRSRSPNVTASLPKQALHDVRKWRRKLRRIGFVLSDADIRSIWRGFLAASLTWQTAEKNLQGLLGLESTGGKRGSEAG